MQSPDANRAAGMLKVRVSEAIHFQAAGTDRQYDLPIRTRALAAPACRCWYSDLPAVTLSAPPGFRETATGWRRQPTPIRPDDGEHAMRRTLLILGLIGLAIGLLWIGQGTGTVAWPRSSFMINEIQWAGYGAALSAVGLILIWQSQRP